MYNNTDWGMWKNVGKEAFKLSLKYFSKTFLLGYLTEVPEVYFSGDMKPFIQGPVERMQTSIQILHSHPLEGISYLQKKI